MLDHPTRQRLRALKLDGMADAFAELQAQDGAADLGHVLSIKGRSYRLPDLEDALQA